MRTALNTFVFPLFWKFYLKESDKLDREGQRRNFHDSRFRRKSFDTRATARNKLSGLI